MNTIKSDTAEATTRPASEIPHDRLDTRSRRYYSGGDRLEKPDDADKSPAANEQRRLLAALGERPYFAGALAAIWANTFGNSEPFPQQPEFPADEPAPRPADTRNDFERQADGQGGHGKADITGA